MAETVEINVSNEDSYEMTILKYAGQRVITLDLIDDLHERAKGTAGRNFRQNKKHFIEGQDYFYLTGNKANEYMASYDSTKNVESSNVKIFKLYLFTESGYLMLVKSLHDDLAWRVQRELVNCYFRGRSREQDPKHGDKYDFLQGLLDGLRDQDKKIKELQKATENNNNEIDEIKKHYQEPIPEGALTLSSLARQMGLFCHDNPHAGVVGAIAKECNIRTGGNRLMEDSYSKIMYHDQGGVPTLTCYIKLAGIEAIKEWWKNNRVGALCTTYYKRNTKDHHIGDLKERTYTIAGKNWHIEITE